MTNQNKVVQLSAQGLEELKAELTELEETKLPAIIERVSVARSHGDLSENAEYHNAKEEQQLLEARISEIQTIISKAKVVKNTTSHTKVGMGSTVILKLKSNPKKHFTYQVVGEFEADPLEGKVSSDSPIGKGLMGKKKGNEVKVQAPAGEVVYLIEDIK